MTTFLVIIGVLLLLGVGLIIYLVKSMIDMDNAPYSDEDDEELF